MAPSLTLKDVMTPSPVTVAIDARLTEARTLMAEHGVSHLPVMDGSVVESILSDRDIDRYTLPAHKPAPDEELQVGDIARIRTFVADSADPLEKVLRRMLSQDAEAVVVLDEGELAGIFTETDACRLLADRLATEATTA